VLEKSDAEALSLVRSLDDAGDIRHNKGAMTGKPHYTEVGLQRGERIIGDLGTSRGDDRQERTLAGVRFAHQTYVGNEL
jgi:hypothetical protein